MSNRLRVPPGIDAPQEQFTRSPRNPPSRRASTNSVLPGRISKGRDIRCPRTQGPRHADFRGTQTQAPHHRHARYRPLQSVTMGKQSAATDNERRKRRTRNKIDSLAKQLSAMDLSPPPPLTIASLLEKLDKMQVDTDAAKADPEPSRSQPAPLTQPQPIPISSHIWLKITLLDTPFIPSTSPLQSISLPLIGAPTLRALQNELIRSIAETCRVRRRAIPIPDSWTFRLTTGGFGRTCWIGQPSREHSLDLLVDEGEPIYQAFAGECRALAEEERARLEGEMMSAGTEERLFVGGGMGSGRRQRKQVNRVVQMVGQQEEPVVLARAWASCEVSFPEVEDVVEMELDDLPM